MATGDNERTAQAVAGKLGIDEVRAGVLPEAKKDLIDQLRREGHERPTPRSSSQRFHFGLFHKV